MILMVPQAIIIIPRGEVPDAFVLDNIDPTVAENLLLKYTQRPRSDDS